MERGSVEDDDIDYDADGQEPNFSMEDRGHHKAHDNIIQTRLLSYNSTKTYIQVHGKLVYKYTPESLN
jgi:hypothetical protein